MVGILEWMEILFRRLGSCMSLMLFCILVIMKLVRL